ncbi:MAG: efflux RND transporter periplasmic adaptor subunit [Chlamydiia bacterium]|nr:efflux RND transporter periplasmic adaptor subunit [Chlamydiia bacterium]
MKDQSEEVKSSNGKDRLIQMLGICNRLSVKIHATESIDAFSFVAANDTHHAIPYDRAIIWCLEGETPQVLAVSGQTEIDSETEYMQQLVSVVQGIKQIDRPQAITSDSIDSKHEENFKQIQEHTPAHLLWLPIYTEDTLTLGLWIERWESKYSPVSEDEVQILMNFLMPVYGSAWKKFSKSNRRKTRKQKQSYVQLVILILLIACYLIKVPQRVVAPCEVIDLTPFTVTAPIDGVIQEVYVRSGQNVDKDAPLFSLEKEIYEQKLRVAENDYDKASRELDRSVRTGLTDKEESLEDLPILRLELEKARLETEFARHNLGLLDVESPIGGVVMMEIGEHAQGRPVKLGERILTLNNPKNSAVRIWVPEIDHVAFDRSTPIKVVLKVSPETYHEAMIQYVSTQTTISENDISSFVVDATWSDQHDKHEDIKLGQKGNAILYGEDVSLLYYFFRKPWATLRRILGV